MILPELEHDLITSAESKVKALSIIFMPATPLYKLKLAMGFWNETLTAEERSILRTRKNLVAADQISKWFWGLRA